MNHYSEQIRFLCKYKLEKIDNETEKNKITKQIIAVTTELKRVKKEIRMCDEVIDNVSSMKKKIRETEEKSKGKEKQRKKDRKYER